MGSGTAVFPSIVSLHPDSQGDCISVLGLHSYPRAPGGFYMMTPALCLQPTERRQDHSSLRRGGREGPRRHGWVFAEFREGGVLSWAPLSRGAPGARDDR